MRLTIRSRDLYPSRCFSRSQRLLALLLTYRSLLEDRRSTCSQLVNRTTCIQRSLTHSSNPFVRRQNLRAAILKRGAEREFHKLGIRTRSPFSEKEISLASEYLPLRRRLVPHTVSEVFLRSRCRDSSSLSNMRRFGYVGLFRLIGTWTAISSRLKSFVISEVIRTTRPPPERSKAPLL